ncbi:unnamed protein product, partial [Mesorhabditis belari]|uniref:Uncharacterized protein n=1 Tax=Mesorhabditis belari TaxID=2138241 RepID=A0AAF3J1C9_9BILA
MSRDELAAVMAVVLPGRKIEELEEAQMQEMILKWLFGSGLSMKHEFIFDTDDDGDVFVVMSGKRSCECCSKDFKKMISDESDATSQSAFDRSPFGSRLAVYHAEGDGSVTLAVPGPYRAAFIPSTSFSPGTVLVPYQLSLMTRSYSFGVESLNHSNGISNHLPERRNSASSSVIHGTKQPQPYTRTKSDTQVNAVHRVHRLEPPMQMRDGRMISDLTEPPNYKPPPPPNGVDKMLNERRGQKVTPIRTQPGIAKTSPKPKEPKEKDPEKEKGFFRSCYREMGTCCLGLCSNFSL